VSGHSLKLHFCMFERSQRKFNSLDCHKFFIIFSINCKVYMFKVWHKSKMFSHVQNIQISRVDNPYFFQMSFFFTKLHYSFWKLERILTLIIRTAKGLELMNFFFTTNLSTFDQLLYYHLHNKSPNIKMLFHEFLDSFLTCNFVKFIFINSSISFYGFLLILVCTLGFFSNLSSIITSFMHISIVSFYRLFYFHI